MQLTVLVDEQTFEIKIPEDLVEQGETLFNRMDRDMDSGWQMSREWVDSPTEVQRCQIVADKLLTAIENENRKVATMMAAYIVARLPGVRTVDIDTAGEMGETRFEVQEAPAPPQPHQTPAQPATTSPGGLSKIDALDQAGRDVTKVFKVGRQYRFSVYDHSTGEWVDSPAIGDKQEAEQLRQQAFKRRFEELCRPD